MEECISKLLYTRGSWRVDAERLRLSGSLRSDAPGPTPLLSSKRLVVHIRGQIVCECVLRVDKKRKAATSGLGGIGGVLLWSRR